MKVWTMLARQYGDTVIPEIVGCEMPTDDLGLVPVGQGMKAYVFITPDGHRVICESGGGAVLGIGLRTIKQQIKGLDKQTIKDQLVQSLCNGAVARMMDAEDFWQLFDDSDYTGIQKR